MLDASSGLLASTLFFLLMEGFKCAADSVTWLNFFLLRIFEVLKTLGTLRLRGFEENIRSKCTILI